jgi:hypothetical protein
MEVLTTEAHNDFCLLQASDKLRQFIFLEGMFVD